jgi:hypothetical protein
MRIGRRRKNLIIFEKKKLLSTNSLLAFKVLFGKIYEHAIIKYLYD